ncbi:MULTISPECIES: hypothetical protein [Virgibacillus]|nr:MULTISPECIES: hypothetical protein [Virgibacillus]API92836.1 hypothetical protein BKP57_14075 [Virgibacillus sp. 6R]MBS7428346.1 hypothetical protein [Virgibacillus sp. 19R1-5]MBU8565221.1 hypothetical protein [Virgibacillus pantothenticus]MBU8601505.1 hypothetical protein [Virgibacillus pantothenticus]MBU8633540.1 hypothetical protein [Virgibacillus pantothenticus]
MSFRKIKNIPPRKYVKAIKRKLMMEGNLNEFKVMKHIMNEIAIADLVTFIALTIITLQQIEVTTMQVWKGMSANIFINIFCGSVSCFSDQTVET